MAGALAFRLFEAEKVEIQSKVRGKEMVGTGTVLVHQPNVAVPDWW